MKNIIISFILLSLFFVSCEHERESVKVTYLVTNSNNGFAVSYQGENGEVIKKNITTQSKDEEWKVNFSFKQGDIVYLSVLDTEANSFVKAMVIVDGKVFKQSSRTNDTTMPIVVSGAIPF